MAKSLLDGVNAILKRVGMIAGDAGPLMTLTDSARQRAIDLAVQVIGEGVDELYLSSNSEKPQSEGETTLVLATNIRSYDIADDVVRLRFPMIDRVNRQYLYEFPGGYGQLLLFDPEQSFTGLPQSAAFNPTNKKLYMDRIPTATENGRAYTYQYDKDLTLDEAADVFPFNPTVFRAMVPVWTQLWKREIRKEFDPDLFKIHLGRASGALTMKEPRTHYSPRMR